MIRAALFTVGLLIGLLIFVATISILDSKPLVPKGHWHSGSSHGSYDGSPLSQEDCEALFGGPGW